MSVLLRVLPTKSFRSRFLFHTPLPVLHLSFHKPIKYNLLFLRNNASSVSACAAPSSSAETIVPNPKQLPLIPLKDTLEWVGRSRFCGELSKIDVGKQVRLCGWVALYRVHGGLTFVNLRDHTGIVQVTTLPDKFPDTHSNVNDLRLECDFCGGCC